MYLILTCSSLFGKVVVQTFFLENKNDVDNAFVKFNDLLSFSPIEIAKIKLPQILSRENREIKYE